MSDRGAPPAIDASQLAAQELQNRFISENLRRVFLLIYRIVRNVDDAQDLTQEAFIKALQRQDQLKELDKAAHWLSRIASNTAIDFLRRNGKVNFCEIDSLVEPLSEPSATPEQAVLRSEHRAYLEEGLTALTGRERTALLLRDVEGLPAEVVAEQMCCSKATVRSHIANARIKMKRYMERSRPRPAKEAVMRHPAPVQIALFSGGDLGRWERWRIARHVSRCAECRQEVQALRDGNAELRELAGQMPDLPNALNWNRLSEEMTGNIRVGLAAGEAIALFDKPLRVRRRHGWPGFGGSLLSWPLFSWNAALVVLGATLIFAIAFWTSLPPQQAEHLLTSLQRIRAERIGTLVHSAAPGTTANPEDVVLEASSSSIQVRENGRALSLMPHSDGATVSVDMPGSASVHFVDADTGQVTTNKVYYAEQ